MKNIKLWSGILALSALGLVFYAFGLQRDVPLKVRESFAQRFPGSTKVYWSLESTMEWEAEFRLKGIRYSANFMEDGSWKETEHRIAINVLPSKVKQVLASAYPGYKLKEAELSETVRDEVYEVEVKKGNSEWEITIDREGRILDKVSEDKTDDNK